MEINQHGMQSESYIPQCVPTPWGLIPHWPAHGTEQHMRWCLAEHAAGPRDCLKTSVVGPTVRHPVTLLMHHWLPHSSLTHATPTHDPIHTHNLTATLCHTPSLCHFHSLPLTHMTISFSVPLTHRSTAQAMDEAPHHCIGQRLPISLTI